MRDQNKIPQINIKNTPENIALFQACASNDINISNEARQIVAGFIGPVLNTVLDLMGTANIIYKDWPYDVDDYPSIPLDKFYNAAVNTVLVWQQNIPGGLGTSLLTGLQELLVSTYELQTAVHWNIRDLRRGRLPSLSLGLHRAAQEMLVKTERNGWLVALRALAEATTNNLRHYINATTTNVIQVDDFNRMITRSKRINSAFNGGTPDHMYSRGATDIFLSPEAMEQIRSFAYQPMNTRGFPNNDESTAVALPDKIREEIYRSSGIPEIFGIRLHEMLEFGIGGAYNNLFASFVGAGVMNPATDEFLLGIDLSRDSLIRPIASESLSGSTLVMKVDDQWSQRSQKQGYWGALEEGRVCIDSRTLSGLIF